MAPHELLLARVRGEFREMPGLRLTVAQASRLWHLDLLICAELLDMLLAEGFLTRSADGVFAMPELQQRTGDPLSPRPMMPDATRRPGEQ